MTAFSSIEPSYCEECGSTLNKNIKPGRKYFDTFTGEQKRENDTNIRICPKRLEGSNSNPYYWQHVEWHYLDESKVWQKYL